MRKGLKSGGLLLLVGYLIFSASSGAYAQQLTIPDRWLTDSVQLNVGSVVSDNVTCDKVMRINVVDYLIKLPSSYDACVEVGKTLNIAHYKDAQNYQRVAVQRTANGNYYRIEIENLVSVNPHLLPNTDTLVISDNIGNNSYEYTNFVT